MSIIYEALNKIQKESIKINQKQEKPKKKRILFIFASLSILTIIVLMLFLNSPILFSSKPVIDAANKYLLPPIKEKIAPQIEKEIESAELSLSGISISDTQTFAIINDNIVSAGDFVDGFRVSSIYADYVELEGEDKKIVLSIKR